MLEDQWQAGNAIMKSIMSAGRPKAGSPAKETIGLGSVEAEEFGVSVFDLEIECPRDSFKNL